MDLNNVTVIIPTRNRPKSLRRLLQYYEQSGAEPSVIVADSSDAKARSENELTCESSELPVMNFIGYDPTTPLVEKIQAVVQNIDTEYSTLCADDDFVTPNGLRRTVGFLENHEKFVCAYGNTIAFTADSIRGGTNFSWAPRYTYARSIADPRPESRIVAHLTNYMQTLYAVHRTPVLLRGFNKTAEATDDIRFGEIMHSALDTIMGKTKRLNVLYSARYSAPQSAAAENTISDFVRSGTFERKYKRFKRALVEALQQQAPITQQDAIRIVNRGMTNYLMETCDYDPSLAKRLVRGDDESMDFPPSLPSFSSQSVSLPATVKRSLLNAPLPDDLAFAGQRVYRTLYKWRRIAEIRDVDTLGFYVSLSLKDANSRGELTAIRRAIASHPDALDE